MDRANLYIGNEHVRIRLDAMLADPQAKEINRNTHVVFAERVEFVERAVNKNTNLVGV